MSNTKRPRGMARDCLGVLLHTGEEMTTNRLVLITGYNPQQVGRAMTYLISAGAVNRISWMVFKADMAGAQRWLATQERFSRYKAVGASLCAAKGYRVGNGQAKAERATESQQEPSQVTVVPVVDPVEVFPSQGAAQAAAVEAPLSQVEQDVLAVLEMVMPIVPARMVPRYNLIQRSLVQMIDQ